MAHHYYHLDDDMASERSVILAMDFIYCILVNHHSTLQVVAVCINLHYLFFTLCNLYVPPAVLISAANLTSIITFTFPIHSSGQF
jgi:hypothetical protein